MLKLLFEFVKQATLKSPPQLVLPGRGIKVLLFESLTESNLKGIYCRRHFWKGTILYDAITVNLQQKKFIEQNVSFEHC
jgi:hypothetical protein